MHKSSNNKLAPAASGLGAFVLAGAAALGLQACGSDGDSSSTAPVAPAATMIQGTVAVGAAVPGANVTVKDADAATPDVTGTADAQGAYALDVSALKPPLVVSASGTLNGEPVSVVAVVPAITANADNTANVTSLTNAVAALIAPGGDLNALTSATTIAALTAGSVANASTLVVNTLKSNPEFAALLGANFDPLKTPFSANGTGIDSVLDQVAVQVDSSGVAVTNLSAPAGDGGQAAPVVLTAAQTSTPTAAPTLLPSEPSSNLPSVADMTLIAKKFEACLALPLEQRVTMDPTKEVTAVSAACTFGVANWKSDGGGWVERMGNGTFRYTANTELKVGQPTIATVLAPPNYSGTTFQNPYCNTQTCVIMYVPMTTKSGKAGGGFFTLAKVAGKWEFVGNQLPYAMGVEQRLNRLVAVNTALATANPSNYFLQDRMESTIRVTFNPDASLADTANVRAVVWKGPGLPAAGVVTHRSQRCGTDDRFPITNQEGLLTVNNSSSIQWWNNGGGNDFKIDAAKLDGTALAMATPTPTPNWATTASPSNQDYRSAAFEGTIPAWSVYTAEIYYYSNAGTTPDEVIMVRNSTPYERASAGATKNWPTLAQATIDAYLKPAGVNAVALNSLAYSLDWTNPSNGYVNFGYLFSQNRITATNVQNETSSNYWKRGSLWFRIGAAGDSSAPAYEWAPNRSGVELSTVTPAGGTSTVANSNNSPNPRCGSDEVLPLDADATRSSYREIGLQVRDNNRKLNQLIHFWSN